MKTYNVTFDFAMWKLNKAKKDMERIKYSKFISTRSDYDESNCRNNVLGKLSQQIDHWQGIAAILCPSHEWENEEGNDYPPFKCQVCGFIEDDYDLLYYMFEDMTQGCHNCKCLEKDGGDSVPYGRESNNA